MPKPKSEQNELPAMEGPGVAPLVIKPLERLGDRLASLRDDKAELSEKLADVEGEIAATMAEYKITIYKFAGKIMKLKTGKNKIEIKKIKTLTT